MALITPPSLVIFHLKMYGFQMFQPCWTWIRNQMFLFTLKVNKNYILFIKNKQTF